MRPHINDIACKWCTIQDKTVRANLAYLHYSPGPLGIGVLYLQALINHAEHALVALHLLHRIKVYPGGAADRLNTKITSINSKATPFIHLIWYGGYARLSSYCPQRSNPQDIINVWTLPYKLYGCSCLSGAWLHKERTYLPVPELAYC